MHNYTHTTHIHPHIHTNPTMCTHIYRNLFVLFVSIYVIYVCVSIFCICMCVYLCMYICMYVYMCVCLWCVHVCLFVYPHKHTKHTFSQTCTYVFAHTAYMYIYAKTTCTNITHNHIQTKYTNIYRQHTNEIMHATHIYIDIHTKHVYTYTYHIYTNKYAYIHLSTHMYIHVFL